MKKILFLLAFVSLGYSQKVNHGYEIKTKEILYTLVPNPIVVKAKNNKPFDISITNGSLTKINDTTYSIYTKETKRSELILTQGKRNDTIVFSKQPFPEPELSFWMDKKEEMSFSDFRKIKNISCVLRNFTFDCTFFVIGMDITRIDRFNNVTRETGTGANPQITKRAEDGDMYIFSNIKIKLNGSDTIINGKTEVIKIVY